MNIKLKYVAAVLDERIIINCSDKKEFAFLKNIGARRKFILSEKWYLDYKTDIDLARHFSLLRDEGFFFSYDQHGWGPSDVFQYLRNKNLLSGNFTEVCWTGPDNVETRKI